MGAPSTAFVKQYQDSITLLVQQLEGRLRPAVMVDTNWTGEEKFYDQYGTDDMVEITNRIQDTPVQEADHERRKVTPSYFVSNTLEDPFEALQMLVDPKSTYLMAKQASANRRIDLTIINALFGVAKSGKTGSTSNSLETANKVTVSGAGLSKVKIIKAKGILDSFEVDKEDRFIVYTSDQMEDLLNSTEVTTSDSNTIKMLVEGDMKQLTWIGFKYIHSEQLPVDGSNDRLIPAFQKKGLQLAIQKEPTSRLDERKDKNYAWQVYLSLALGAVRLEEERVVQIACQE